MKILPQAWQTRNQPRPSQVLSKGKMQMIRIVSRLEIFVGLNTMHLPKKGTDRAIRRVDITRDDLSTIIVEYFCWFGGSNSSKLIANGIIVNAYVFIH
jgi:hypothetical protein